MEPAANNAPIDKCDRLVFIDLWQSKKASKVTLLAWGHGQFFHSALYQIMSKDSLQQHSMERILLPINNTNNPFPLSMSLSKLFITLLLTTYFREQTIDRWTLENAAVFVTNYC